MNSESKVRFPSRAKAVSEALNRWRKPPYNADVNKRTANIIGGIGLLLFLFCGGAIAWPIMASARVASELTRIYSRRKQMINALAVYTGKHNGLLPGRTWKRELEAIDPALKPILDEGHSDGWHVGYAGVPGTFGKNTSELDPGTVLFVSYKAPEAMEILSDPEWIGTDRLENLGLIVQVQDLTERMRYSRRLAEIGYLLGRQNPPNFKSSWGK